jgi:hypothetical protein
LCDLTDAERRFLRGHIGRTDVPVRKDRFESGVIEDHQGVAGVFQTRSHHHERLNDLASERQSGRCLERVLAPLEKYRAH